MPTGAPHSVDVLLVVVGRVVVDHQHELLDVEAARRHARRDEQAADVRLEVVDGGLAVALVLAAVQRQAGVAHLHHGQCAWSLSPQLGKYVRRQSLYRGVSRQRVRSDKRLPAATQHSIEPSAVTLIPKLRMKWKTADPCLCHNPQTSVRLVL